MPQIMILLSNRGKVSMIQGIPPVLAQICVRTFVVIDLRFLPKLIVPVRMI